MPRRAARHEATSKHRRGEWLAFVASLSSCILPEVESTDAASQAVPSVGASQASAPVSSDAGASKTSSTSQPQTMKPLGQSALDAASATPPKETPAAEPPPASARAVPDASAPVHADGGAPVVDVAPVDPAEARADAVALAHTFATWSMPDSTPGSKSMPSYTIGDKTVTDDVTHLVWQRNIPAMFEGCTGTLPSGAGVPGEACSWAEAKKYCGAQTVADALGGAGWRVPTKIELESLIDVLNYDPALDRNAFPVCQGGFWTATPAASSPTTLAWFLNTTYGYPTLGPHWGGLQVRCVR